jgi:hypothetical protein
MGKRFASGKKALGICDRCGLTYKLLKLKPERVNLNRTNILVCPDCFDVDHPQHRLGQLRQDDPQALRNPRPDTSTGSSGAADNSAWDELVWGESEWG